MVAAQEGRTQAVIALLSHGANANAAAHNGLTALMLAARFSHVETAVALLQGGAALDAARLEGSTALALAHAFPDAASVQVLMDACATIGGRTVAALHLDYLRAVQCMADDANLPRQPMDHDAGLHPLPMADGLDLAPGDPDGPIQDVNAQSANNSMDEVLTLGWTNSYSA